ncbi:VWA domain-containing protein [Marinilongibacter aquaticus]|uniref:vWA domain-containing protein n=1 Tax=Marinilongibacter aquaticus TaxID=2975157 RepID=UPI0021BD43AD|nr:VWA domain-containing protein [Marinilongibacter aquaticus]UBM58854.1 VWA domain-containing protein [Marinilongibacter aquaticus]
MKGFRFASYVPNIKGAADFDQLFDIFQQLLLIFAGDVAAALDYMNELDRQYNLTSDAYAMADFIQDLKDKGYIQETEGEGQGIQMTAKSEKSIRKRSLEEIFGKLKRSKSAGNHRSTFSGQGGEKTGDLRSFRFGDNLEQINLTESLKNAQVNSGLGESFQLTEKDLEVVETETSLNTSTVLMIDVSHSMILYGEDRITPAKKVALAMAELIKTRYPKDTLDILVFGNDAWTIQLKDIPYLEVGPYHTNTVAGLELAMDLLRRRKNRNKQIFMITDGKPTCLKEGINYYKNAFGLDRKIVNKTLTIAAQARRMNIPITTFMIASDPYLKQFVRSFTEVNKGRAYYSNLDGLGGFVLEDFERNRRRNVR